MKTQITKSFLEITEIENYNAETKELNHPRIEKEIIKPYKLWQT